MNQNNDVLVTFTDLKIDTNNDGKLMRIALNDSSDEESSQYNQSKTRNYGDIHLNKLRNSEISPIKNINDIDENHEDTIKPHSSDFEEPTKEKRHQKLQKKNIANRKSRKSQLSYYLKIIHKSLKLFIEYFTLFFQFFYKSWILGTKKILFNKKSCKSGFIFIVIGLLLSFLCEVFPECPTYNLAVIISVMIATEFQNYLDNSIRPQILIFIILIVSFIIDFYYFTIIPVSTFVVLVLIDGSKGLLLLYYLTNVTGTDRIKKYLDRFQTLVFLFFIFHLCLQRYLHSRYRLRTRCSALVFIEPVFFPRLRVFCFPCRLPRRLMREIRNRILAIEWIEFAAMLCYGILFIISVTSMNTVTAINFPSRGIALPIFLIIKTVTTAFVYFFLWRDTGNTL